MSTIYEADAAQPLDPMAALIRCIESGAGALLFAGRQLRFFPTRREAIAWLESV